MIRNGSVTLDPITVKDLKKEELYEIVKGKLDSDFELFWNLVCKSNGNDKTPSNSDKRKKA